MAFATTRSAYGAEYLAALLAFEGHLPGWSDAPGRPDALGPEAPAGPPLVVVVGPPQDEIDRHLSLYEAYARTDGADPPPGGDVEVQAEEVPR
jgi:hypothetical protein